MACMLTYVVGAVPMAGCASTQMAQQNVSYAAMWRIVLAMLDI